MENGKVLEEEYNILGILDRHIVLEEPEILDEEEKEYLSAIIKPFKDRDIYITKRENCFDKYFLRISVDDMGTDFPYFEKDTMYKGMKLNKEYSLKDLGLEMI